MNDDDRVVQRTRRRFLVETAALAGAAGMGLALDATPAPATPASMRAAIRKVVGEAPLNKGKLKIDVPALIENGNAVPFTVSCESPMTESDHVKAIHVFTEKNPQPTSSACNSARAPGARACPPASASPTLRRSSPSRK